MKSGLEEFLKRIEQKPTNETLIDRFITLVLEEEILERIFYLKKLVGLLLNSNPYAALKAAALELQEARKENMTREYELGALKDVESCFIKLDKQENVQFIREEINKFSSEVTKSRAAAPRLEMPLPKPQSARDDKVVPFDPSAPRRKPEATLIDRQRAPLPDQEPGPRLVESTKSSLKKPPAESVDQFSFVDENDDDVLPQATRPRQAPAPASPVFASDAMEDSVPQLSPLSRVNKKPARDFSSPEDSYEPADADVFNYAPSHLEKDKPKTSYDPLDSFNSDDFVPLAWDRPAKNAEFDSDEAEDTKILPGEEEQAAIIQAAADALEAEQRAEAAKKLALAQKAEQQAQAERAERQAQAERKERDAQAERLERQAQAERTEREAQAERAELEAQAEAAARERLAHAEQMEREAQTERSRKAEQAALATQSADIFQLDINAAQKVKVEEILKLARSPRAETAVSLASLGIESNADAEERENIFAGGPLEGMAVASSGRPPVSPPGMANFKTSAPGLQMPLLAPVNRTMSFDKTALPWDDLRDQLQTLCDETQSLDVVRQFLPSQITERKVNDGATVVLQFLDPLQTRKRQYKLLAWVFEALDAEAIQAFWAAVKMVDAGCEFFQAYLTELFEDRQFRRALNVVHGAIRPGLDMIWYRVSYDLLQEIWEHLGLRAWNWQEEEGAEAFCRRLQRREDLLPLAVFA